VTLNFIYTIIFWSSRAADRQSRGNRTTHVPHASSTNSQPGQ